MSEAKGLTLRKKGAGRAPISAPQLLSGDVPAKLSPIAGTLTLTPSHEKAQQSDTADLVKRRYSTRFNQLPDFSALAPPVPPLPGATTLKRYSRSASPVRPGTSGSAHVLRVDTNALNDPSLQPEKYITDLLSHASEQDIQHYQNNLGKVKNSTSTDLQQSIYQNRTHFIRISKEAEKLKGEMMTLRGLMSDLTGALGQANSHSNTSSLKPPNQDDGNLSRRKANRSSVANLESMWNVQLQTLWKNIEQSQKFLPAIPGRHVVMETARWVELDSATWKPKRPVHIVLLNDHLLIASKKRKRIDPNNPNHRGPAPTKLVAEECWPLQEVDLLDLSASVRSGGANGVPDGRNIVTAISIRTNGKTFTYRHAEKDEGAKAELLLTFRKTAEELRKTLRSEDEQGSSPDETLNIFPSRNAASAQQTEVMASLNSSSERAEIFIDVDGKQQSLRFVESQIDELDIDIALQRFEDAITKVEKLRELAGGLKNHSVAKELVCAKVDERAAKLAATLTRALVDTPAYLEATKANTSWLARLGFDDRARRAYLAARTDTLIKRARQCIFEGDLLRYIFQISFVYFTMIKNTAGIFQACFAPVMMSACVKWAKEHLESLNALLVRQLSSVEKGGKMWRDCMDVVWREEGKLGEVGLDFREVIGRNLETR